MNLYVKSQNCPEGASYAVSYGNLGKAEDGVSGYLREVPWEKKRDIWSIVYSIIQGINNSPTFELASVRLFSVVDFPLEG